MEFFSSKIWIFLIKSIPTPQIKYKRINFAPCNKWIMANKLLLTNLERFLRRINSRKSEQQMSDKEVLLLVLVFQLIWLDVKKPRKTILVVVGAKKTQTKQSSKANP